MIFIVNYKSSKYGTSQLQRNIQVKDYITFDEIHIHDAFRVPLLITEFFTKPVALPITTDLSVSRSALISISLIIESIMIKLTKTDSNRVCD